MHRPDDHIPGCLENWELEAFSLLLFPDLEHEATLGRANHALDSTPTVLPGDVRTRSFLLPSETHVQPAFLSLFCKLTVSSHMQADGTPESYSGSLGCRRPSKFFLCLLGQPFWLRVLKAPLQEAVLPVETAMTACMGHSLPGCHLVRPSRLECLQQLLSQMQPAAVTHKSSAILPPLQISTSRRSRSQRRQMGAMATKLHTVYGPAGSTGCPILKHLPMQVIWTSRLPISAETCQQR